MRTKSDDPDQSKTLKTGDRVCFNGDASDVGTVMATETRYVTIRWQDGHRSLIGHKNMQRVELVLKKRRQKSNDLQGN